MAPSEERKRQRGEDAASSMLPDKRRENPPPRALVATRRVGAVASFSMIAFRTQLTYTTKYLLALGSPLVVCEREESCVVRVHGLDWSGKRDAQHAAHTRQRRLAPASNGRPAASKGEGGGA